MASRTLGSVIFSAPGKLLLTPQVGPAVQPIPARNQHWLDSNSDATECLIKMMIVTMIVMTLLASLQNTIGASDANERNCSTLQQMTWQHLGCEQVEHLRLLSIPHGDQG